MYKGQWAEPFNLMLRIGLFAAILSLGTAIAWAADEAERPALERAVVAPAQMMTTAVYGHVLYAALIQDSHPSGIYRSEDHGRTWQLLGSEMGAPVMALGARSPAGTALYAGSGGAPPPAGSVWRSADGGQNWREYIPGIPTHPYGLAPGHLQAETLVVRSDGPGEYYFDSPHNRDSYDLVGALSLYNYRPYDQAAMIAPDGRVYTLAGDASYPIEENGWQRLARFLRLATGLAVDPLEFSSRQEQSPFPAALANVTTGAAVQLTALAYDKEGMSCYVAAAMTYDSRRQVMDHSLYVSHDDGRHWSRLTEAAGMMVIQVPAQALSVPSDVEPVDQTKLMVKPSLTFSPGLSPLDALTGMQWLILVLTLGLAALALLDKSRMSKTGHAPV